MAAMLGVRIGTQLRKASGEGGYCDEYQAVYDAMTTKPSDEVAGYWNTMVSGLVDDGVWDDLDGFQMMAVESNAGGDAVLDWIRLSASPAFGGTPAFTSLEGMNFASGTLSTDYNPSTDGDNIALNDTMFFYYTRDTNQDGDNILLSNDTGDWAAAINPTDRLLLAVNGSQTYNAGAYTGIGKDGIHIFQRAASGSMQAYRNNVEVIDISNTSNSIPDDELLISPLNNADKQLSVVGWGASLDSTKRQALQDRIETMMDANGKGVIT